MEEEIKRDYAVLIGASTGSGELEDTDDASMNELAELAKTAGAEVAGIVVQNIKTIDPRTIIGKGKVEEIREFIENNKVNLAIFDRELSGSVTKNLENDLGVRVIDRSRLILDIFAGRATSKEGKCQVELAQMKYILPRLAGIGSDFSRQGGGIGTRGPGETKLESDRRHIQRKIETLTDELKEIAKHRMNIRKKRQSDNIIQVAVVGYTNAGKSSLVNLLTGDNDAYVENQLFATLDPIIRKLKLSDRTEILISDTVGFIRKLPHHLIEAFKSTLEEVKYADIIIHLIDASSDEAEKSILVAENILKELEADNKPCIRVFNKCDVSEPERKLQDTESINISVKENKNIDVLKRRLEDIIASMRHPVRIKIPYADSAKRGYVYKAASVLCDTAAEDGYIMEIIADEECFNKVKNYIILEENGSGV